MSIDLVNFNPRFSLTNYVSLRKHLAFSPIYFPKDKSKGDNPQLCSWGGGAMSLFVQRESIECWLPFFNGECPQFSQSQLCPVASLQPWALETQKHIGRGQRRASFCSYASPDSPLFITAKKISSTWQVEGVAVVAALVQNTQALVVEPCGPWDRT